jgi:hypothetical protein
VQEATERYVAALPTDHRVILGLLASRRGMAPSQLVAGLIADVVGEYQREEQRNTRS